MKLKIYTIEGKGELEKETLWIDVLEDTKVHFYMVSDTTYTSDNKISNELRHLFGFPQKDVVKGDWIALHTKNGSYHTASNSRKTTTHSFYWNLGKTVWNKAGDAAVLFELADWKTTKV